MLLERPGQLGDLRAALAEVSGGSAGRIVLLSGEAGAGKTALLHEFCALPGTPARMILAACEPLFTPRPFGPLLDLAESRDELHDLARAPTRPADLAAGLLAALTPGPPTVLVLEDVHWADEATLDVIRLLARRLDRAPVLLVLSYRDDQLGRSHPLRIVLGDLPKGGPVTRVTVGALSPEAVGILARPAGIDATELYRRTGGNPFFVTEVLASGSKLIPVTVKDAVLARVAALGTRALDLLDAVAVVPGRAEEWLVAELAKDSLDTLDDCLASGMLTAGAGWIAFRHEIARLAVEDSLPPRRRTALHRAALAALTRAPAGQADVARLAHHAEAAGDGDAVLRYAPAAAKAAIVAGARREAAGEFARALRFADLMNPAERAGLLESFAGQIGDTSQGPEALTALGEALAIHRDGGDLVGQGRVLTKLGKQLGALGQFIEGRSAQHEAVTMLRQAPPVALRDSELARAYAGLATSYALSDEDEAIRWGSKAIALADEAGCADALVYTLNTVGTIELRRGEAEGLAKLERSRELAVQDGDEAGVARAYLHLALVPAELREWERAERYLGLAAAYFAERGLESSLHLVLVLRAECELARGQWTAAEGTAARVLTALPDRPGYLRARALAVLARARARRGTAGYWPPLDEAAVIVRSITLPQAAAMVAEARAEAAWLDRAPAEKIRAETEDARAAERTGRPWFPGAIACWRWRAGLAADDQDLLAEPYRLEMAGDHAGAARWWRERGCGYEAALALASSGDPRTLREALTEFHRLGAWPAAAIITRRLRALGERGVPRGPRAGTAANPAGLTRRETEILTLLAGGLSNAEIAVKLVVSVRTVDHHVAAILRKLGARNRAEVSEAAARMGLLPILA